MTKKVINLINWTSAITLGCLVFLLIVGPRVLDGTNIAWLTSGDPSTGYLGWEFFRHDQWRLPFALNPHYGLEVSSSIIYSDSNVLFAFIFKLFSVFLPEHFQYFGIWLLVCFVLQALFAWKLIGIISNNFFICLFGTCLFLFAPIFLWRLYGHYNLVGHFFILFSLYIIFKQNNSSGKWLWLCLIIGALLVHSYLAAMVISLWIINIIINLFNKKINYKIFFGEILIIFILILITLWGAGYFSLSGRIDGGGYGVYCMNLLSLFNPNGGYPGGWSYILKPFPDCLGNYEGFNYLGLGGVFLLIWASFVYWQNRKELSVPKKYYPLCVLLFGFTLYAISTNISFLNYKFELIKLNIPLFEMFRASGRFFWPVFYMILFLCILLIVKFYTRNKAIYILIVAALFQIFDTHIAWSNFRDTFMKPRSTVWNTPLKDKFWEQAALQYSKIRYIPTQNLFPEWVYFAKYAVDYNLETDITYLARIDADKLNKIMQHNNAMITSGIFEKDTLYILQEQYSADVIKNIDTNKDFLGNVDGFYVLAPDWKILKGAIAEH